MKISQSFGDFFSFHLHGKFICGLSVSPYVNLTIIGVSEINDYAEEERIVNRFSWPEGYLICIGVTVEFRLKFRAQCSIKSHV
jgi:hypothetical protein